MTRFTRHIAVMISLRSSLLNQPRRPFLSSTEKQFWTAGSECNLSMHNLQADKAAVGLSTVSSTVAITRYPIATMRSEGFNASSLNASVAFLRESSNLFLALERVGVEAWSMLWVSFKLDIAWGRETTLSSASYPGEYFNWGRSYNKVIPSSKKSIADRRSFLARPSSFDLTSWISRTITSRNFWSVISPCFSFSAAASRPFCTSKPTVALKTAVKSEAINTTVHTHSDSLFHL